MHKICFFISTISSTGGTERVSTIIANALAKKGYEICFFNLIGDDAVKFELDPNIDIFTLNLPEGSIKKNFFKIILAWRDFVKNKNIDVVVDVDSILSVFTVPAMIGLPVQHICWEHFNYNVDLGVKFRKIGRLMAAKFSDYVITLSDKDKSLWRMGIKNIKAKIVTIHNPCSYENVINTPKLEYKIILAVGRLTYQKGFDMLISVWSKICKKNTDWKLTIVGSGEEEESLKNLAKKLDIIDRINFIPATTDIQQYYKTSSLYCMSSRFEGFGLVLLEAQAFGLPIVSFDCDCGPSDILENEVNGILVENGNLIDLEENLLKMMNLKEAEYSQYVSNSFEKIKNFSLDSSILYDWIDIVESHPIKLK